MNLTLKNKSKTIEKVESTKNVAKKTRKFSGDGLILDLKTNERDIEITGDGCKLTVAVNNGKIRICGDGCRLRVQNNSGSIEYRGDGGRVSLGAESTLRKIDYFGDGGKIDIGRDKNRAPQSSGTVEHENQGHPDIFQLNLFSSDPARKKNSPTFPRRNNHRSIDSSLRNESSIESNAKKHSPCDLTKKQNSDNFANELFESRNIDARSKNQKQSEICIRTTIQTVRIFYEDPKSAVPKKTRTGRKNVNACSDDT